MRGPLYSSVSTESESAMVGLRIGERAQSSPFPRAPAIVKAMPLLVTVAAGLICYALFFNRGLGLSVIGYNIAPAERVLQGDVPYRDFLFNYTPGILWANALLMKTLGATLMATRIGLFGFKLITLLVLFHIGRRLTNRWAALLPVALSLAWIGHQQIFNVYPDQYLMLFALAALICMLNYNERNGARWLILCGLATGAVFVFKYNVGGLLVAAGASAVAARELMTSRQLSTAMKSTAVYLIGFAVIPVALVVYLIRVDALGAMVNHFLHHAAEYSETRSVTLPPASLILSASLALLGVLMLGVVVNRKASRFFGAYIITVIVIGSVVLLAPGRATFLRDSAIASVAYFPPFIFAAALVLGFLQFKNERAIQRWWQDNGALTITGLFAIAVYLEVFPRADYYHLVRVLPPVFLFFCVLVARCFPALKRYFKEQPSPSRAVLLVVSVPLVFLVLAGVRDTWVPQFDSSFHFKDNRELTIERGRGILVEEKQADLTEGLVRLIQDNSAPNDYIFSFAQRGSAFYFLSARRNATRFLWWRSVGISSEERDAVMKMIADQRARLIIIQDVAANREIQDFIATGYDHIGTVSDIAVYGLRKPFSDAASDKLTVN